MCEGFTKGCGSFPWHPEVQCVRSIVVSIVVPCCPTVGTVIMSVWILSYVVKRPGHNGHPLGWEKYMEHGGLRWDML